MDDKKLYNPTVKERYLSKFENEGTQTTIKYLFYKTEVFEDILKKDLYNFTLPELETTLRQTNPYNINVAKGTARFVYAYITWAIDNRYRNNIHPMDGITNEWYEGLVDKTKKIHYSKDELIELVEQLENEADKSLLFLMFEGIIGEQFSEISPLKISDIDKENCMIYVAERNESVKVSEECIKYVLSAAEETTYKVYNDKENTFKEKDLLPSDGYIFKNVRSPRAKEGQPVNFPVFYTRLSNIKNQCHLEYLTANGLRQSGMQYMASQLLDHYKGITNELLDVIGEKYNFSKTMNQGYENYNYSLMREFISPEFLRNLYNIEVNV